MIVYNITTKVALGIEAAWLQWQKETHIPEIMASGKFSKYNMYRLLEHDDDEGVTYVIQFTAVDLTAYQDYIDAFDPLLRKKAFQQWGNQFIAFRSLLEVIH